MNPHQSFIMRTIQLFRVLFLLPLCEYWFTLFWFDSLWRPYICCPWKSLILWLLSRNLWFLFLLLTSILACVLTCLLCLFRFLFALFRHLRFLPSCATGKYSRRVLFLIPIFLIFILINLNVYQCVCSYSQILHHQLLLIAIPQQPFRKLNQYFHYLHRRVLLQQFNCLIVSSILFVQIIRHSCQSNPHLCLQWSIGFLHVYDCLQFILSLFAHKNHFSLPNGFLHIFRNQLKNHVSSLFSEFVVLIL